MAFNKALVLVGVATCCLAACGPKPGGGAARSASDATAASAPLKVDQTAWTPFTEPTEQAFTGDVPAGWKASGGVVRSSAAIAKPWMTAASPDGTTLLYLADPTIPILFTEPAPGGAEGQEIQGAISPMTVMTYRKAIDFAKIYGAHTLPGQCGHVQLESTKDTPELLAQAKSNMPNLSPDAGMALFSCDIAGKPYEAGVYFVTTHAAQPGLWFGNVLGFRTPKGQAAAAEQLLMHLSADEKPTPQWQAQMAQAAQQEGAAARARLTQSWDQFGAKMRAQQDQLAATMKSGHDAYMAASQQAADTRNARFVEQQYDKSIQNRDFLLMVKGHHLERAQDGTLVEVPD